MRQGRTLWIGLGCAVLGWIAFGLGACDKKPQLVDNDVAPVYVQGLVESETRLVYGRQDGSVSVPLTGEKSERRLELLPDPQLTVFDGRVFGCSACNVVDVESAVTSPFRACQALFPLDSATREGQYLLAQGEEESAVFIVEAAESSDGAGDVEQAGGACNVGGMGGGAAGSTGAGHVNPLISLREVCHPKPGMMFDQAWAQLVKDRSDKEVLMVPAPGSLFVYLLSRKAGDCATPPLADVELDLTNSQGVFGWKEAERGPGSVYIRGERSTELFRAQFTWNDLGLGVALRKDVREVIVTDILLDLIDDPGHPDKLERLFVAERGSPQDLAQLNQRRAEQDLSALDDLSDVSTLTMGFISGAPRVPLALQHGYFVELNSADALGHRWTALVEGADSGSMAHRLAIVDLRNVFASSSDAIVQYESDTGFHSAIKVSENSLALLRETAPGLLAVRLLHHPTGQWIDVQHAPDEAVGFEAPFVSNSELRLLVRTPHNAGTPWRLIRVNDLGDRVAQFELPARARAVFEQWSVGSKEECTPCNLKRLVVDHPTAGGMVSIFEVQDAQPSLEGQVLTGEGSVTRGFLRAEKYPP